jgi:transcriptional regulator with XRE-family HTH domain
MGKEFLKEFGKRIRYLRELTNTTQEDLRKAMGYTSTGAISQIENGSKGMKLEAIAKAATFFGIHPAILISPISMSKSDLKIIVQMMDLIQKKDKHKHYDDILKLLKDSN